MKKHIVSILLVLTFFAFGATYAYAQDIPDAPPTAGFIDSDGDGVCDYWGTGDGQTRRFSQNMRGNGAGFVDADADGVCDNVGTMNNGAGAQLNEFVDADGDGVCDNLGTALAGRQAQQRGRGRMHNMQP